jgi:N-acetylmuramoyl-L-alanine amidase CwlA
LNIDKQFLTPNKYSRPQTPLKKVTKIAVHYVGNAGSSAQGNRNYFESLKDKHIYASSHYIIGLNGEIIQCIPEEEISYATNQANSYSISIECCHPDSTGKFNDKTLHSLIDLCVDICKRYKLNPLTDIIRHYDVTRKKCPLYWVNNPKDFELFKITVNTQLIGDELNMTQYQELKKEIDTIFKELEGIKQALPKVYNTVEEIPEWGKEAVNYYISIGALQGEENSLNMDYNLLRLLVVLYRINNTTNSK